MSSVSSEGSSSALNIWKELNDNTNFSTNWLALQFDEGNGLIVKGSGSGGYKEGYELLKEEIIFLLVRGCHKRMKIVQRFIVLVLYIPDEVTAFQIAEAAYRVDVLSEKLKLEHFCLVDSRKDKNLEIEHLTNRIKEIIGSPGKYIIDEESNTTLQKHYEDEEKKKEKPQSEKKKQTEQNVFKEILETEETYVRSLNLFMTAYITPLKDIVKDFHRSLFTLIGIIVNINEEFLNKLRKTKESVGLEGSPGSDEKKEGEIEEGESSKKHVALMVDILVSQCPVFKLYLPYVNEYAKLQARVNNLTQKDAKFRDFCNKKSMELQKQGERCTNIGGFLIMPIQRIPRYQLLMRDLLKQTHPKDPNYPKIKEGLDKTLELAQYVNTKKAESVMSVKTIEISQNFKMNDLMDLKRKMLKYCDDIVLGKNPGEICVFTDLVLLFRSGKKKVMRFSLDDPDIRVYSAAAAASDNTKKKSSPGDENAFVLETQRKRNVVGFKNKDLCESFIQLIQTRLSVNLGQAAMSQKLMSHIIFQSMLLKDGRGRMAKRSRKKRWHELTADLKMKYYDKRNGKMKGSYSVVDALMGKGDPKKKPGDSSSALSVDISLSSSGYDFYIKTAKRTYQLYAGNVEILDIWIRVLEMVGLKREDLIDAETEKKHQLEYAKLLESRDGKAELAELRARQAKEEERQKKVKEENYRKMFLKLNSMIKSLPEGEEEEEGEDESSSDDDDDDDDDDEEEGEGTNVQESEIQKSIQQPQQLEPEKPQQQQEEKVKPSIPSKKPARPPIVPRNKKPAAPPKGSRTGIIMKKPGSVPPAIPSKKPSVASKPPKAKEEEDKKEGGGEKESPSDEVPEDVEEEKKKKTKNKEEEDREYRDKVEHIKRKNLMHTELRVRRRSIMRSEKLIDKIRQKRQVKANQGKTTTISVTQDGGDTEEGKEKKEEEEEDKKGQGELVEIDIKSAEKVIHKKTDLHTELLMKKKKKTGIFGKFRFGKKKKTAEQAQRKVIGAPRGFLKKGGNRGSRGSGGLRPPPPSKRCRPVTVTGSLRGKLKGLEEAKLLISSEDAKQKDMEVMKKRRAPSPPPVGRRRKEATAVVNNNENSSGGSDFRRPPRPAPRTPTSAKPTASIFNKFPSSNIKGAAITAKARRIIPPPKPPTIPKENNNENNEEREKEFEERLEREKEKWMNEELPKILEEKKKEWVAQESEKLRIQIRQELIQEMKQN